MSDISNNWTANDRQRMVITKRTTPGKSVLAIAVLFMISGCTSIKQREYAPFVRDLDGLNQLEISTYPADFPNRLSKKGAIDEKYESADDVYFQVFIRDPKKSIGSNPHVQSVTIHSFSYQIGNGAPTVLLSGYEDNFWMQGNPRYDKRGLPPVPFEEDGEVYIRISFTLNGRKFAFEGGMPATEQSRVLPTFIWKQGV